MTASIAPHRAPVVWRKAPWLWLVLIGAGFTARASAAGPVASAATAPDSLSALPAEFHVWSVDEVTKLLPDAEPGDTPSQTLRVAAARTEAEAVQLAVRSSGPTPDVTLTPAALTTADGKSALPESSWLIRCVGYVPVKRNTPATPAAELAGAAPGLFPDPLVDKTTIRLTPGRTAVFWITVTVPEDQPAGIYAGEFRLQIAATEYAVPVQVRVFDFALPAAHHVSMTNWFSPGALARFSGTTVWSEDFWRLLPAYARDMAAHRQDTIRVPLDLIGVRRDAATGKLQFDFDRFDRFVDLFAENGVSGRIEGGHLGKRKGSWTSPTFDFLPVRVESNAGYPPLPNRTVVKSLLIHLELHLQQKGWLDRFAIHIADEPTRYNYQSWLDLSRVVKLSAPKLRRIDAIQVPNLGKALEIAVPQLDVLDENLDTFLQTRQENPGSELWFYTCMYPRGEFPNRFIDFPLIKTRLLGWILWKYRCSGFLHWGYNFWSESPWTDVERSGLPPGDSFVVYPSSTGPVDSMRWEAMRDGLEDYEYFWLLNSLQSRLPSQTAALQADDADVRCDRVVKAITDYDHDSATLLSIREQVGETIEKLQRELAAPQRDTVAGLLNLLR